MKRGNIIRLGCIVALWVIFSIWLVSRHLEAGLPITLRGVVFPIVASGIIVFVPMYKKYKKDDSKSA